MTEYIVIPIEEINTLIEEYEGFRNACLNQYKLEKDTNPNSISTLFYNGRLIEINSAYRVLKKLRANKGILTIPVNNNKNGT